MTGHALKHRIPLCHNCGVLLRAIDRNIPPLHASARIVRLSMSLDADHIVDRRRMRRKLTFWRVPAVVVAVVAILAAAVAFWLRGVRRDKRPQDRPGTSRSGRLR